MTKTSAALSSQGIKPKSAYRFAIPKASLGEVRIILGFDGTYPAATFTAAARRVLSRSRCVQ